MLMFTLRRYVKYYIHRILQRTNWAFWISAAGDIFHKVGDSRFDWPADVESYFENPIKFKNQWLLTKCHTRRHNIRESLRLRARDLTINCTVSNKSNKKKKNSYKNAKESNISIVCSPSPNHRYRQRYGCTQPQLTWSWDKTQVRPYIGPQQSVSLYKLAVKRASERSRSLAIVKHTTQKKKKKKKNVHISPALKSFVFRFGHFAPYALQTHTKTAANKRLSKQFVLCDDSVIKDT